jgi:hypothetical protein
MTSLYFLQNEGKMVKKIQQKPKTRRKLTRKCTQN